MTLSLIELSRAKNWIQFNPIKNSKKKILHDDVWIQFESSKKSVDIIDRVKIEMHVSVLSKLKMKKNEVINILYHPDDLYSFMLVKSQNKAGYKTCSIPGNDDATRIYFKWNRPILLEKMAATKVEYLHIKESNSIVFRASASHD